MTTILSVRRADIAVALFALLAVEVLAATMVLT